MGPAKLGRPVRNGQAVAFNASVLAGNDPLQQMKFSVENAILEISERKRTSSSQVVQSDGVEGQPRALPP
jgi:hypothetical protein